jgi:hypothetical protein
VSYTFPRCGRLADNRLATPQWLSVSPGSVHSLTGRADRSLDAERGDA